VGLKRDDYTVEGTGEFEFQTNPRGVEALGPHELVAVDLFQTNPCGVALRLAFVAVDGERFEPRLSCLSVDMAKAICKR